MILGLQFSLTNTNVSFQNKKSLNLSCYLQLKCLKKHADIASPTVKRSKSWTFSFTTSILRLNFWQPFHRRHFGGNSLLSPWRQSRNIFPLLDVTLATLDCPPCATWTETSQCLQGSTRSDVLGFYKISLQIQWHLTCWIPRGHSFLPRTDQGVAVHEVLLCFCLNCFIYFFHRSFYPTDQSKSAEMLTSLLKVCYRGRQLL